MSKPALQQQATFGLLPESEGMNGAYAVSAIVNVCLLALFMVLSLYAIHQKIVAKQAVSLTLVETKQPEPIKPKPVVKTQIVPPTPDMLNNIAPKIVFQNAPVEEAPHMAKLKMDVPNAPVLPPYKPVDVALPPQPKVGMFQSNTATIVANNMGHQSTKMGGFGDTSGAHTNANSTNSQVAAYGSFSNSTGSQTGAGMARRGSVQGVNFGSGYAGGQVGGAGHGKVASVGFGTGTAVAHGPVGTVQTAGFTTKTATTGIKIANTQADFQQVQILFHPTPEYTQEARQMHIQGEVVLQVKFAADGSVHVIRVVHGLGHGLDEQAIRAAEQTRFKPATKDGQAIDMTTYYRIDFQLA